MPIIKSSVPILEQSDVMKKGLSKSKLIPSSRQPKNLKQILCTSKYTTTNDVTGVTKCDKPRCGTCPLIVTNSEFVFNNRKCFSVKSDMNCRSKNVILVLTCAGCGEHYIGETGRELKDRVTVIKQQIRHPNVRCMKVSKHIAESGNCTFTIFLSTNFWAAISNRGLKKNNCL